MKIFVKKIIIKKLYIYLQKAKMTRIKNKRKRKNVNDFVNNQR